MGALFCAGFARELGGFVKKLIGVASMAVVLGSATAFADPDPARVPLAHAFVTVQENSAEHPGNKGLLNASQHLTLNILRQQAKRENHPPGQQKKAAGGAAGETLAGAGRTDRESGGEGKRGDLRGRRFL